MPTAVLTQVQPFKALETVPGRLATFQARWRVSNDKVVTFPAEDLDPLDAVKLARAGFYYCPDSKHLDRCVCFSCKKALHSWARDDSPLYEHCKWSPKCDFVQSSSTDNLDDPYMETAGPASSTCHGIGVPDFVPLMFVPHLASRWVC